MSNHTHTHAHSMPEEHTWQDAGVPNYSLKQVSLREACRCGATRTRLAWQDTGETVKMAIFPARRGMKRAYFRNVRGRLEPCRFKSYQRH